MIDLPRIAWDLFTPWNALAGGALIGTSAALYLLGNGRIAGITGIVASPLQALLSRSSMVPERTRLAFLAGLLLAPAVWRLFGPLPAATLDAGPMLLVAGGLLVGFGTRLGGGCTSGHGVCGLARFSRRSLVSVPIFMAAAFATVFVTRHLA
jgi:uncharacterized protein